MIAAPKLGHRIACLGPKANNPLAEIRVFLKWVRPPSTPIAEELDLVPHTRGGHGSAKTQDAAQLLANREPLLWRQNHSGMLSPGIDPLRVKSVEIRHVECVEDTPMFGSEGQLFVVGLPGETSVQSRDHGNAAGTKGRDKIGVHRVFVDVDLDPAHK
jgi:hypothetical protein